MDQDAQFFADHPKRQARIRVPEAGHVEADRMGSKTLHLAEEEMAFRQLGGHDPKRRRILVWRIPKDNPVYDPKMPKLLKVPFLLFADETVEDNDEMLLPILHEIMMEAQAKEEV